MYYTITILKTQVFLTIFKKYIWRSQGVTIPFFQRDRLMCVHEHFETKSGGNGKSRTFTVLRMKEVHYRYATLPYRNTLSLKV
jgi:hypothetical protein